MFDVTRYDVRRISRSDAEAFILGVHYAKRWPSISDYFGLFKDGVIKGVVTYGKPASSTLRVGVAGPDFANYVLELNRLCLVENAPNEASFLVGQSLRALAGDRIIVSFADIQQGHNGAIYRATNFLYCGLSAKRTDWKVRGKEHLHGQTIADEFRGVPNRAAAMRAKYGDDFYLAERSRKHRYVRFIGSRRFRRDAERALRYPPMPFVKRPSIWQAFLHKAIQQKVAQE